MTELSPVGERAAPILVHTKPAAQTPPSNRPDVQELNKAYTALSISGSAASWGIKAYVLLVEHRICECCGAEYVAPATHTRVLLQSRVDGATRTISLMELRERLELKDLYGDFMLASGKRTNADEIYPTLPRYTRVVTVEIEYCDQCFFTVDIDQSNFWPVAVPPRLPASYFELLKNVQHAREEERKLRKTRKRRVRNASVSLAKLVMGDEDDWFGSAEELVEVDKFNRNLRTSTAKVSLAGGKKRKGKRKSRRIKPIDPKLAAQMKAAAVSMKPKTPEEKFSLVDILRAPKKK